MALILCIETTTTNCSVSLSKDGKSIGLQEFDSQKYSHSEKLHLFIRQVCEETGFSLKELQAVAVSKGPGSYTGLRIGVSAAKGLCFALDIPLIGIETLQILAQKVNPKEVDYIIPMLDARRMEVYTAVFDSQRNQIIPTEAKILEENSFQEYANHSKVIFIGNGVKKFEEISPLPQAIFMESNPSAENMCLIAERAFQQNDFEDLAYFEPYYLKDFVRKNKGF